MDTIDIAAAVVIPCDDRCMFAKHEDCDCECQGVNHQQGFGRMAADIHAIVGGVAVDAVRTESGRDFDRLDQLHRLDVEHRRLRMVAGEPVPRLRAHGRAVAAHADDRSRRFERVEIENGQTLFEGRHRRWGWAPRLPSFFSFRAGGGGPPRGLGPAPAQPVNRS